MKIYFGSANNGVARVLPATSCGVVLQHLMLLVLLSAPSGVFGQDYGKATGYEWIDFNRLTSKPDVHKSKRFSEERGGWNDVDSKAGFYRMDCYDKACDDKEVYHANVMGNEVPDASYRHITNGSNNLKLCHGDSRIMSARMKCSGRYCSRVWLACTDLIHEYRFKPGAHRNWLPRFSQEDSGSSSCPDGAFVTGMECTEGNCDTLRLQCRKVQKKQYFKGCKSFTTRKRNDKEPVPEVEYFRGAKGDQSETMYPLYTEISLSCDHEPYWYPSTPNNGSKNLKCTTDGWKEDRSMIKMDDVHCDCGKCFKRFSWFPTSQTKTGVAKLKIDDNKPKGAKQCTSTSHSPEGTTVKVTCKFEPFMTLSPGVSAEMECQNDGSWKNSATFEDGEDYCKCNVECPREGNTNSKFCLGVDEKTSINSVKFEWLAGSDLKIDWKDSCQDTQYKGYQMSLLRRYWSEADNAWTSKSLVGVVKRGQNSEIDDISVESDVPDHVPFVPGLRIQYEWKQEAEFDNGIVPFAADEKDRTKVETTVPFLFDFSALITSPDRSVDTVGATITVIDVLTGKELYAYVTPKRSLTPGGAREQPEVLPVRLDSFGTGIITREVIVTVNYLDHEFSCDPPLCSESGKAYVGNITHLEPINLFFTDTSVVTIEEL